MKKRYCPVGLDEDGNMQYVEHGSDGSVARTVTRAVEGKPVPPGRGLAHGHFEDDGHLVMEDIVSPNHGPAQVATEAYRSGWDRTFN